MHQALLKLFYLCALCAMLSLSSSLKPLSGYQLWDGSHGNYLEQFERYLNLTAERGFPHDEYVGKAKQCFAVALARNITWFPCIRSHIAAYGRRVRLDSRLQLFSPLLIGSDPNVGWRKQDCTYRIDEASARLTALANGRSYFTFAVQQSNCSSFRPPQGGAALETIAHVRDELVGCSLVDLFTDRYQLFCPLQTRSGHAGDGQLCVDVTMVLDYEHFGAFDEFLLRALKSPGLRSILYDHHSLCTSNDITAAVAVAGGRSPGAQLQQQKPSVGDKFGRVVTFSGHWVKRPLPARARPQQPEPFVLLTVPSERPNSSYTDVPYRLQNALRVASPTEIVFVPHSLLWDASTGMYIDGNSAVALPPDGHLAETLNPAIYEGSTAPRGDVHTVYTSQSQFTFVGCSHVRYLFNALALEAGLSLPTNRKHGSVVVGNLRYIEEYMSQHQASRVEALCHEREAKRGQTTWQGHVLVLQPGAWDTDHQSPRMILCNNQSADALLDAVARVLSGALPCGGLTQILWLSAMPYPLCIEDPYTCNLVRNHRSNGAISAVNEYFLRALNAVQMSAQVGVVLSVVDVFSIIYPRLLLNEPEEVVCDMHYLCRLKNGKLFFTHGGAAYIRAVKAALKWGYS